MVKMLVRDIASPDRRDPLFPFLRCFDKYAGHSWASGDANFADGNNQESSSESLNAWYGLILWGAATGDAALRDTGLFLFNTERTAVEEYWFDVSGSNFPKDFPNVALGMLWGGKGAFAPGSRATSTASTASTGCPSRPPRSTWAATRAT